jgi:hypothetical protein
VTNFVSRGKFGINLIIVLDGLIPQYLSDKDKILNRSKNVWDKHSYNDDNDKLKVEILKNYGVRFYHQEIVRSIEHNTSLCR